MAAESRNSPGMVWKKVRNMITLKATMQVGSTITQKVFSRPSVLITRKVGIRPPLKNMVIARKMVMCLRRMNSRRASG